jgi:hypothetical protein
MAHDAANAAGYQSPLRQGDEKGFEFPHQGKTFIDVTTTSAGMTKSTAI